MSGPVPETGPQLAPEAITSPEDAQRVLRVLMGGLPEVTQVRAGIPLGRVTELVGREDVKSRRRQDVHRGRLAAAQAIFVKRFGAAPFGLEDQADQLGDFCPPLDRSSVQAWLTHAVPALQQVRNDCDHPLPAPGVTVGEQLTAEQVYLRLLGAMLEAVKLLCALGILDQAGYERATLEIVQTREPRKVGTVVLQGSRR